MNKIKGVSSAGGARPKTKTKKLEDWQKCQTWLLGLGLGSAKIPSLDSLREEHDLYIYLKVAND